jgi:hypothetical protein
MGTTYYRVAFYSYVGCKARVFPVAVAGIVFAVSTGPSLAQARRWAKTVTIATM